MKKIRVLIIDSEDGELIKKVISELLLSLNLGGIFYFAKTYDEAEKVIYERRYGLISLGDIPNDDNERKLAINLMEPISKLNPNSAIFSLFGDPVDLTKDAGF